jgi:hypothetical protein
MAPVTIAKADILTDPMQLEYIFEKISSPWFEINTQKHLTFENYETGDNTEKSPQIFVYQHEPHVCIFQKNKLAMIPVNFCSTPHMDQSSMMPGHIVLAPISPP